MAPRRSTQQTSDSNLIPIYRPRKDERQSWPGWLTCSGRFTHISGHPSATDRAQDRESTPAKDRHSTAVPRNQLGLVNALIQQRYSRVACPSIMWDFLRSTCIRFLFDQTSLVASRNKTSWDNKSGSFRCKTTFLSLKKHWRNFQQITSLKHCMK